MPLPAKVLVTPGSMPVQRRAVRPARLEFVVESQLGQKRLVDGHGLGLTCRHVEIVDSRAQAAAHDRLVELGYDGVDHQLGASRGRRHLFDIARIQLDGCGFAQAHLAGDEPSARLIVVGQDDAGHFRTTGKVPGEHVALHAGADDEHFHVRSLLSLLPDEDSSLPLCVKRIP